MRDSEVEKLTSLKFWLGCLRDGNGVWEEVEAGGVWSWLMWLLGLRRGMVDVGCGEEGEFGDWKAGTRALEWWGIGEATGTMGPIVRTENYPSNISIQFSLKHCRRNTFPGRESGDSFFFFWSRMPADLTACLVSDSEVVLQRAIDAGSDSSGRQEPRLAWVVA